MSIIVIIIALLLGAAENTRTTTISGKRRVEWKVVMTSGRRNKTTISSISGTPKITAPRREA